MAHLMDDLIAFLKARLDEDEQRARAAGNRRWLVQDNIIELHPEREDDGFMSWPTRADARHAANWDPARVLREVEAKQQIISLHRRQSELDYDPICNVCCYTPPCETLRVLTLPYSDHPDYQEMWRL